jgi:hypothetical protein
VARWVGPGSERMKEDTAMMKLDHVIGNDLVVINNICTKCKKLRNFPAYDVDEVIKRLGKISLIFKEYHREVHHA